MIGSAEARASIAIRLCRPSSAAAAIRDRSVTARAGATPSSPLPRMSESTFACLAFRSMLSRGGAPKARLASPVARIARSSGPSRNSAPRNAARARSAVIGPATRHGVGPFSPGAVPVKVAAPANRSRTSPPAGSPSSTPSNSPAGQLGPASTSTRSGVPSGPGFCEASLKTTGASSGPENWPVRWAGPSRDGTAASMSTPAISDAGPLATPATRTRPSRTIRRSTPVDCSRAIGNAGNRGAPSEPRTMVRTGLSRLMSENRIWPLVSLTSASSSRAESNDSLGPSGPGADNEPAPRAR